MKKIILATVILLSGCASVQSDYWVKTGSTQQDYNKIHYQCLKESQQYYSSSSLSGGSSFFGGWGSGQVTGDSYSGAKTNKMLYNSCMRADGWEVQYNKNVLCGVPGRRPGDMTNLPKPDGTVSKVTITSLIESKSRRCRSDSGHTDLYSYSD